MRPAHRSLTPSMKYADPGTAGASGFFGALNDAMNKNRQFSQQQQLQQGKQKSALELAMERFYQNQRMEKDKQKGRMDLQHDKQGFELKHPGVGGKGKANALSPQEAQFLKDMGSNKKVLQTEADKFDPMKNPTIIKQFPELRNMDPVSRYQYTLHLFADPKYPDEGVKNAYNYVFAKDESGMSNASKAKQIQDKIASQVQPTPAQPKQDDVAQPDINPKMPSVFGGGVGLGANQ